jgi:hypothetical protein
MHKAIDLFPKQRRSRKVRKKSFFWTQPRLTVSYKTGSRVREAKVVCASTSSVMKRHPWATRKIF